MGARLRRSAAALALVAGAALAVSCAHAACAPVDAQRLAERLDPLPGPPAHVRLQVLPLPGAGGLRWAAVSWSAPPDGAVVVVDCAGRPLASEPVGPMLRIRPGPAVDGRPTLQAIYWDNAEASAHAQSVALLRYAGSALAIVWRHEISELSKDAARPERGVALTWRWRFSRDGRFIKVTGEREAGELSDLRRGSATGPRRRLKPQGFCWIPGRRRFDRCAP